MEKHRAIQRSVRRPIHRAGQGACALLLTALLAGCSATTQPQPEEASATAAEAPKLLSGLGAHRFPVTTASDEARRYFHQGLALSYGFNHAAAIDAFAYAAKLDPGCAACWWGQALALGPNINAPMGPDAAREAYAAVQRARDLAENAGPMERALIEALALRYAAEPPEDRAALDLAYANAMRGVQARFPEDLDVATLTAESLMDLYPWNYWTKDAKPREHTAEIVSLLEGVIAADPTHVGASHYYIHAVEEHFPEKAEAAADRLTDLAPDAGHLVHMPSHIYWRVGRYEDAADINVRAAQADERYFALCRPGAFYRALYYPHNVHFLWAAAAAEGQSALALTTARKLAAKVEPLHAEFPLVEEFLTIPHLTLVRFGQWDAALGEPAPPAGRPFQEGVWHYARGIAQVRLGRLDEAEASLGAVRRVAATPEAKALVVAGGTSSADVLLGIGADHLAGELASARGDTDAAVALLERAVAEQDGLAYIEPPAWYFPTRQALGAVLLEAGRAADAEPVYRTDLAQYPKNGWSLYGLARSLEVQGRPDEADWAQQGHRHAFARADVTLASSRF
jgi:tetratricopeptide (TPR) repeat protein